MDGGTESFAQFCGREIFDTNSYAVFPIGNHDSAFIPTLYGDYFS